jgi:hypothetical protein
MTLLSVAKLFWVLAVVAILVDIVSEILDKRKISKMSQSERMAHLIGKYGRDYVNHL